MISLLRRIRKKLLREGSFGAYFAYALGEIILIIVGILAALWIDGSNQDRQEARQEQFYLTGLRDEFASSLTKLDTLIAVNQRTYGITRELLIQIQDAQSREDEKAIANGLIAALSYEIAYNPNNALLREILNSGRMQILSDPQLRRSLMSWEPFLESVNRQESTLRARREGVTDLVLGPEGSILTIMQDAGVAGSYVGENLPQKHYSNLALLKSREFENKLIVYLVTSEATESNFYLPLRKAIVDVLNLIDKNMDQNN